MRRCACLLLIGLLFLSVTLPAYADDMTEYEMKDLGMTVSLPASCFVMTLDELSTLAPEMAEQNKQLGEMTNWNIVITAQEGAGIDFRSMSDENLEMIADAIKRTAAINGGATASDPEVYESAEAKFVGIQLSMDNDGQAEDMYMYLTANGYHAIYFTIYDREGRITDEEKTTLKELVDSVRFTAVSEQGTLTATPEESTGPLTYEDAETGTVLTLPENWVETPFSTPKEFNKAKFVPQDSSVICSIMYGWQELPEELSLEEMEDFEANKALITGYLNMLMPDNGGEIENIAYGDNDYFVISGSIDMLGISYPIQMAAHMSSRYLFAFSFMGSNIKEEYHQDFESLLASAEFIP